MSKVYSVNASSMFSIDENGKHSLEVAYKDSDGTNVGAYSEGDTFDGVLKDVLDQIDAAIADADDARADQERVPVRRQRDQRAPAHVLR